MLKMTMVNMEPKYWKDQVEITEQEYFAELEKEEEQEAVPVEQESAVRHFKVRMDGTITEVID